MGASEAVSTPQRERRTWLCSTADMYTFLIKHCTYNALISIHGNTQCMPATCHGTACNQLADGTDGAPCSQLVFVFSWTLCFPSSVVSVCMCVFMFLMCDVGRVWEVCMCMHMGTQGSVWNHPPSHCISILFSLVEAGVSQSNQSASIWLIWLTSLLWGDPLPLLSKDRITGSQLCPPGS